MTSVAASKASVATRSKHHLFSLPQEVQDEIFTLAYPRRQHPVAGTTELTVVDKFNWDRAQLDSVTRTHKWVPIEPYPGPKVNQFLVSKRYFVAAARAYVSNQKVSNMYDTQPALFGIIAAFASDVKLSTVEAPLDVRAKDLPAIKSLELRVGQDVFAPLLPRSYEEHLFTVEDMEQTENWKEIVELVKQVTVFSFTVRHWWSKRDSSTDPRRKNFMLYEQSLRPYVGLARRREIPPSAADAYAMSQAPLYAGSAVLWQRRDNTGGQETTDSRDMESTIDITNFSCGARKDLMKRLIRSDARLAARMLKDHMQERAQAKEDDDDDKVVFTGRGFTGLHWLGKVIEDLDLENQ